MCNAWNHHPSCQCGWGGDGHLGKKGAYQNSVKSIFSSVPPILGSYRSYTIPNASCPVCGNAVFFYFSPHGGRVFFDELGPPWPKHPCTDNTSSPARLRGFPNEKVGNWSREGWKFVELFSIESTPYKYVLRISLDFDWRSTILYTQKSFEIEQALKEHEKRSMLYVRSLSATGDEFELSFLLKDGSPIFLKAYTELSRAVSEFNHGKRVHPEKKSSRNDISRAGEKHTKNASTPKQTLRFHNIEQPNSFANTQLENAMSHAFNKKGINAKSYPPAGNTHQERDELEDVTIEAFANKLGVSAQSLLDALLQAGIIKLGSRDQIRKWEIVKLMEFLATRNRK